MSADIVIEDSELATKVRAQIRSLFRMHKSSVSLLWNNTSMLQLVKDELIVQAREDNDFFYLSVRRDGSSVANVSLDIHGSKLNFATDPKPKIPWGKTELRKILDSLSGYKPMNGVNVPYGYVQDGQIVAIIVRLEGQYTGHDCSLFVLEGESIPDDRLFRAGMSNVQWCDRFWALVKSGKIVPLREGKGLSWWMPADGSRLLRITDMTSNKHLLAKRGKYTLS